MRRKVHVAGHDHVGRQVFLSQPTDKISELKLEWEGTEAWSWVITEHQERVKHAIAVCLMTGEQQAIRVQVQPTGEVLDVLYYRMSDRLAVLSIAHEVMPEISLSRQEMSVLRILLDGKTIDEVAATLKVHVRTVNKHRHSLLRKFGATNDVQLGALAIRSGLV